MCASHGCHKKVDHTQFRVQVSVDTRSERETARSAARELSYLDFKPEQLKVVLTFIKGRDVFAVLNNIH